MISTRRDFKLQGTKNRQDFKLQGTKNRRWCCPFSIVNDSREQLYKKSDGLWFVSQQRYTLPQL